jgi:hypothetical protein
MPPANTFTLERENTTPIRVSISDWPAVPPRLSDLRRGLSDFRLGAGQDCVGAILKLWPWPAFIGCNPESEFGEETEVDVGCGRRRDADRHSCGDDDDLVHGSLPPFEVVRLAAGQL